MNAGLQRVLTAGCQSQGLPVPVFELHFHPTRRWRFDASWPDAKVALEVEGGLFMRGGGAHNHPKWARRDLEKHSEAAIHGWRLLRCMPEDITNGRALGWIQRAMQTL